MKEPSEHGYPWRFQLCRFSERAVNAVLGDERSERGPENVLKVAMTERPPGGLKEITAFPYSEAAQNCPNSAVPCPV